MDPLLFTDASPVDTFTSPEAGDTMEEISTFPLASSELLPERRRRFPPTELDSPAIIRTSVPL